MSDIEQFRDAIRSAGLEPPERIEADGKLRRFSSNGKRGDDAGWYVLHGDGIPAGSFGYWRTGISESWRADIGRTLSLAVDFSERRNLQSETGTRVMYQIFQWRMGERKQRAIFCPRREL
jgi:putative DNA primase/helicase